MKDTNTTKENENCYSCGGKGYYTQIHGETGYDDFGGEGYEKKPEIHKYPCNKCNGTGFNNPPTVEISKEEKEYDRKYSHAHCWNQGKNPACGQPLKNHRQCCLCDKKYKPLVPQSTEEVKDREMFEFRKGKVSNCHKRGILVEYGEYICEGCNRVCIPEEEASTGEWEKWVETLARSKNPNDLKLLIAKIKVLLNESRKEGYEQGIKDSIPEDQYHTRSLHAGADLGVQEERERIRTMIEGIDDSGGGSGRRIKIQLLDMLSSPDESK